MLKGTKYIIVITTQAFFFYYLSAQLCDELLEEVFVETVIMEGDKAIGKIALVCKRFKDIVSTERFWKKAHYLWLNSK